MSVFNSKIALSLASIAATGALIVGATFAFFSDTESSTGNLLQAGKIDLKIDNSSYYNGKFNAGTSWLQAADLNDGQGPASGQYLFFNFDDLKPGDYGEDIISLHVETNDSWVCSDVTLVNNKENDKTLDETQDGDTTTDPNGGELAGKVNFIWWADDGDNVLETGEQVLPGGNLGQLGVGNTAKVTLADSQSSIWSPGPNPSPFPGNGTRYIGKAWCFGNFTINPLTQDGPVTLDGNGKPTNGPDTRGAGFTCDGSQENNTTQTDSLTADIKFTAIQARHNSDFTCAPPPPPEISCTVDHSIYASNVISSFQGRLKNGNPITDSNRTDPSRALGAPQSAGNADDTPVIIPSFYSLGFPHTNNGNVAGNIVLDMGQVFYPNPSGTDLNIYEVTGGTYPVESVAVEAKLGLGDPWTPLGTVGRDGGVELGSLTSARYIRLTEASNIAPFEETADGYDLDAVKAFCTAVN